MVNQTSEQRRESMLAKAERIAAYNKYVQDTSVKTDNTVTLFWAKDISVSVSVSTDGIAFGSKGISIQNIVSIENAIDRLDEFIAGLQQAREELSTVKNEGGLNNGRI